METQGGFPSLQQWQCQAVFLSGCDMRPRPPEFHAGQSGRRAGPQWHVTCGGEPRILQNKGDSAVFHRGRIDSGIQRESRALHGMR